MEISIEVGGKSYCLVTYFFLYLSNLLCDFSLPLADVRTGAGGSNSAFGPLSFSGSSLETFCFFFFLAGVLLVGRNL